MNKIPLVTLDTTLADLYGPDSRIASIPCGWTSGIDVGIDMPRNKRLLFQLPIAMTVDGKGHSSSSIQHIEREDQIKFLSLIAQRDAFGIGKMGLVLFSFDEPDGLKPPRSQLDAEQTMQALSTDQRPQLIFCSTPKDVPERLKEHNIDIVAPKLAWDSLEEHNECTLPVEKSYYLNSKTAIGESGLPAPATTVIRLDAISFDAAKCCQECSPNADLATRARCTGARGKWVKKQIAKVIDGVTSHSPPFVLKTNQSQGGGGTFIVQTKRDQEEMVKNLEENILPNLFWSIDKDNMHLEPGNILLMDMVSNIVGNWGLAFFVARDGKTTFVSVTSQMTEDGGEYQGSMISYLEQDKLKRKFGPVMKQVAKWAHGHGYYGPLGADILETKVEEDPETRMLVIDLNVRIPGSLGIGLMKGHLSERRGLHEACSMDLLTKHDRRDFIAQLSQEFEQGRVTILSWYRNVDKGVSYATVVVAGEGQKEREQMVEQINKHAEQK